MLCEKCMTNNGYGAHYCSECGEKFSQQVREQEYRRTIWGKFQRAEDAFNKLTLKKVTDHILFQIFVLLLVLGIGLFKFYSYGSQLRVLPNDSYQISYNETADEYYVATTGSEVKLSLYVPLWSDSLSLVGTDAEGNVLLDETLAKDIYEEEAPALKKGAYDKIIVSAIRDGKVTKTMTIKVVG